jgi:hypothetical protein
MKKKNYFKHLNDVEHVADYTGFRYDPRWRQETKFEVGVYVGKVPWAQKWVTFEACELADGSWLRSRRSGIYSSRERAIQRAWIVAQLEDGRNL